MFFRLTVIAFLLLQFAAQGQSNARPGILDASRFNFSSYPLSLKNQWLWVDNELVDPQKIANHEFKPVEFPKVWNEVRANGSGLGVATYQLTVTLPKDLTSYAIELPQLYSSYKLWANGKLIASNGQPGINEENTQPQWLPQTVAIDARDTLRLLLQIANFQHDKGGCRESIYLGEQNSMLAKQRTTMVSKVVQCVTLLFLAVIFIGIYFFKGRKKVIMYFALLCATWMTRSAFSNEYLFISFFPDFNWNWLVRIEYITLYLTIIWAILFLIRLFPREGNNIIKYILVIINIIFVGITTITEPLFFTQFLNVYLITAGVLLLYGMVVIASAFINGRAGATFLAVSALLGVLVFSYDIFTYEGLFSYNSVLFNIAYIFIFVLLGLALLLHLGAISLPGVSSDTLTYKDLYKD
jgi:hypothetical protein